ncbi:40S ribosomal protein S21 [Intoshia linei]|uniref:40S ribosomal protein S21 n=1 Tax=Intoshia linei TaxID=1819745 RepID=A0A177B5A4_9BILA|nr:40S ribosomal protein S21 [Intoshia linei]
MTKSDLRIENHLMYIPKKCMSSGKIIGPNDHGSVQIQIAKIDSETGVMTDGRNTVSICGQIRLRGGSDEAVNKICCDSGVLNKSILE